MCGGGRREGRVGLERRMGGWRWVITPVDWTLDFSVSAAVKCGIAVLVLLLLNTHEIWTPVRMDQKVLTLSVWKP